jgi:carboxyl-terminal processing protease
VTRKKVEAPTVSYKMLDSNIAYIQIAQFEDVTGDQFTEQIAKAREDGMKALILDLRNNPGGTLTSVIEVARQLLPKGLIVYTEDKNGERDEYKCDGSHELEVPLVVLVNENSASASEILSGAIKDYGIGTLLGTTTFGKGIVQKVFGITDGSAVKLTISHYYTPNGNDIHGVGIEPDETLDLDVDQYLKDGTDNQLERATEILEGEIAK